MKTDTHALQPAPDAHGHGEHHAGGSRESYLIGFGLSVILTAIPFWLVMSGVLGDKQLTGLAITVLAAIQIVVHMVYFLHMNTRSEGGWTMMALIFTIIMVVIGLAGSEWVMHHLNVNMMPGHEMSGMK
ncbi:cytochrome o ubiquinol oxidase subunit IV [Bradyrhizobium sp. Ai1a-2]|uniref:cytochrome o ubiquinol oxidase subunit IV n=1 Tax=Bradyrhizobium sp. Ai1a-2 TaxID=196490 RepID=UPI0004060613|nr:cytochrome o ubiquinol oxidase subunit IV [Bradyrhizobium sp. Ai1a-2]